MLVLDASISAAWALPDETSELAGSLLTKVHEEGAVVPSLWWYEIRNVLLVAERRKRISAGDADAFIRSLAGLAIRIEALGDGRAIVRLARVHQLSVYGATYLDLAIREGLPLGTFDRKLSQAAACESVSLLGT